MSVTSLVPCVVVLFLQLWGAHTLFPTRTCQTPCLCEKTPLLNCSSSGLSKAPSHIPATATALDLSHNALKSLVPLWSGRIRLRGLRDFWVGDNVLENLSMCLEKVVDRRKTLTGRKERCVSWAPDLQLLSAERNQLKQIPRGLCSVKSLQVLHLSYNKISELGSADLAGCTYLKVVHLQHNLISTIHPQAFKDLSNLQVLDLSYNLLTIIPLPAYLSLRNLNTLVAISGNKWRCDCNIKTIRRWLSFDNERSNSEWKVVCSSPVHHAGKDLLDLEESDLKCSSPVYSTPSVHKEMTVDEGTELLLSCAIVTQDSSDFMRTRWWTPHGQVSENQQVLLISNITEQHAGLYVCVSGLQEEHVSVFNLHVHKRVHDTRLRREVQDVLGELTEEKNNLNIQRNVQTVKHSDFVLAVCLSVFITFIIAFVLGVLLRPLLDKLWKRIRTKRNPTSSENSRTSTMQPNPYVNEGYSEADEQVQEVRVGSRVTFGGVTEVKDCGGNIPYYVTVEDDKSDRSSEDNTDVDVSYEDTQESESSANNIEIHCVEMEELRCKESSNPSSLIHVSKQVPLREVNTKTSDPKSTCKYPSAEATKVMEFEHIPDPGDTTKLEERRISPVSYLSELPQELESSYEVNESIEQNVDSPIHTMHENEESNTGQEAVIPRFMTDQFSGKEENVDDLDPDLWNDSGESFSFTEDSPRSSSRVTQMAVLDYPLFEKEMSVDKQSDELSSCNSSESGLTEGEQTEYTVNSEENEEPEICNDLHSGSDDLIENHLSTPEQEPLTDMPSTDACFRQDTVTHMDPSDVHMTFTQEDSFDDRPFTVQHVYSDSPNVNFVEEEPRQYHVHPVYRISRNTTTPLGMDRSGAYSSSEDENEQAENADFPRTLHIKTEPEVNREGIIPVKSPNSILDINFDNSSSSTDIEEKTNQETEKNSFKRLSGPSTLLFNRNGTDTDKNAVYLPSKTTNNDNGKIGGFLGLPFNRETVALEENVKSNTSEENFFETIGLAFNQLPKNKKSLLFSVSDTQTPNQYGSAPEAESGCDSKISHLNFSSEEGKVFFGKTDLNLDAVPKVKRYLKFSQSGPQPSAVSPLSLKTVKVTQKESGISDSSEDELIPATTGDRFFGQISPSLDGVPKVKRYIQFTTSEPQHSAQPPSTSVKTVGLIPVFSPKTQSIKSDSSYEDELHPTSKGNSFFEQISPPVDGVPKVKRYIQFTQSESQPSAEWPLITVNTERVTPELETKIQSKKLASSSEDEFMPNSQGDSFFRQISPSLDGVPKVKRYIQFTMSEPQHSTRSPSTSVKTVGITPVFSPKTQSIKSDSMYEDALHLTSKGNSFFEQISPPVDGIPKVKRYIQFTQSEPQPSAEWPLTTVNTERVTTELETKIQSKKLGSSSEEELSPTSEGDSFFGQISPSLDGVPKVKRYIQFTASEPQHSTRSPSTSVKTVGIIPVFSTKTQSIKSDSMYEDALHPTSKGDSFFEQISPPVDGMPKVKRYIQFTQSEPQPSAEWPLTTVNTERVTPELETKIQSENLTSSFEEELSPISEGDSFFGQISLSLDGVPKVKRCIQFTTSEPQHSAQSPSTSVKTAEIIPVFSPKAQSIKSDSSFEDELHPTSKGDSFFEQISPPVDGVPKVKRYIQFQQSELQSTSEWPLAPLQRESITPVLASNIQSIKFDSSPENEHTPTSKEDNFFKQINTTLDGVPEVKRYIQFTLSEPQLSAYSPTSLNTESVTPMVVTKLQSMRSDSSSGDEWSPTLNGDNFFGQINTSLEGVPKVTKYIQFTQSKPPSSAQSASLSVREEWVMPKLVTKIQSGKYDSAFEDELRSNTKEENFFGHIGTSLDGVPKVKRYVHFTQSEASLSAESSTSPNAKTTIPKLLTKIQSGRLDPAFEFELGPKTNGDFFEQVCTSFVEVPKVKRYIQFTQSEPQPSGLIPLSIKTEIITPELDTKTQSLSSDFSSGDKLSLATMTDSFFGQTGASLNGVPKVKRYIQFTKSEPQPSSQLIETKIQPDRSDTLSGDKLSPVSKGEDLFEESSTSLDRIPKVKRYIEFIQSEPLSQTLSQCTPLTETEPKIHAGTEIMRNNLSDLSGVKTDAEKHSFFGQLDASLDEIPKVKKYIEFTQSVPQHSAQPAVPYLDRQMGTPELFTTELKNISSSDYVVKPINQDTFWWKTDMSFCEIPKVKTYIHFTEGESHPSGSSFNNEAKQSSNNFFERMYVSLENVPKVKRYLQFTHTEPKLPDQLLSPSLNKDRITTELVTKTELISSNRSAEKDSKLNQDNFFDQLDTSLDVVPKVRRYIQFSQNEIDPTNPSLTVNTQEVMIIHEDGTKAAPEEENLFEYIDSSVKRIPKLNRYLKFTHPHVSVQSSSLNTERVTESGFPAEEEFITTSIRDSFLPIGTSLDGVPKVKRHIQFTQSEPQTLSFTPSDKTTDAESKLYGLEYQKGKEDNFFRRINASFDQLPKVKRYVQFTQADALGVTSVLTTKAERRHSLSSEDNLQCITKAENVFGQIPASLLLNGVPKVTRYIQFGSKPHSQTQISEGRAESRDSEVNVTTNDKEVLGGQIERSFNTVQRPKMSLVFTASNPPDENQIKSLSSRHYSSFPVKVASEARRSELRSRPKRTLFFSNSDPYGQPEELFTSSRPELPTTESETISDSKLSSLSASQGPATGFLPFLTTRGISESIHDTDLVPKPRSLGTDVPLQNVTPTIKVTPPNSSGKDEAKEYLRDSSQARQRHDRRRLLFEQKRRAMDRFRSTTHPSASQESEKQGLSDDYEDTIPLSSERTTFHSVSTGLADNASHKDVHFSGSEGLTAKRISSLKYKSALHYGTYKYRSDV